ncbi:MAG: hypothetical protein ACT4QA_23490 [Panacagrimonas sp.]
MKFDSDIASRVATLSLFEPERRLELWAVVHRENCYTPPELCRPRLNGKVYGHPRFDDGTVVTTSDLVGISNGRVVTASGSIYTIGRPRPEYEAAFPNARERLLGSK